uniref:MCM C-terminal AAA(+) ATPase domain-containing protein n=2 Tax=Ditylum brightwellii TaxID=49249 RepID=A0A7S4QZQ7_9STRA
MAKSNQDGLLEAMEQQQISIAKAGVVASLPARCSVIAAANPKNGNYNMGKTVAENLAMATPLLSRFDLVFILRDRADLDQDRMISSNIMDLYRQRDGTRTVTDQCGSVEALSAAMEEDGEGGRVSLSNRLRWVAGFQREPLPADLVRDYISYAREYCRPKMTQEAATVLKDYFMNLRYPPDGTNRGDCVPITTRQLEALIRLSQARAKACLRDFVLKEDAEDVKELMMESVNQVHMDEQGVVDRTRGGAGGKSKRKAKQLFMEQLRHYAKGGQFSELTLDHLRIVANQVKLDVSDFRSFIEELRGNGELMKTSAGAYIICS